MLCRRSRVCVARASFGDTVVRVVLCEDLPSLRDLPEKIKVKVETDNRVARRFPGIGAAGGQVNI